MGYADDGESVSMRTQRADVERVPRSAHQRRLGTNVVALVRGRSYTQSGATTRGRQCVARLWSPAQKEEAQEETEKALACRLFAILAAESEQVFSRRA